MVHKHSLSTVIDCLMFTDSSSLTKIESLKQVRISGYSYLSIAYETSSRKKLALSETSIYVFT
jgi:hypothetical protein